jgi:hypothetical protein
LGAVALSALGAAHAQAPAAFSAEDLAHAERLRAAGLEDRNAWACRTRASSPRRRRPGSASRHRPGRPCLPAFAVSVPDADRMAALQAEGKSLRLQFRLEAQSDVQTTT